MLWFISRGKPDYEANDGPSWVPMISPSGPMNVCIIDTYNPSCSQMFQGADVVFFVYSVVDPYSFEAVSQHLFSEVAPYVTT